MSKEQREFVERLLDDWADAREIVIDERYQASETSAALAKIPARRAEFERLFPKESD